MRNISIEHSGKQSFGRLPHSCRPTFCYHWKCVWFHHRFCTPSHKAFLPRIAGVPFNCDLGTKSVCGMGFRPTQHVLSGARHILFPVSSKIRLCSLHE